MYWIHVIIVSLFLQTFFITGINGNVIRRRRQQQQQQQLSSGSLYGNQISAGNAPAGYNYPQNTNLYGTNLNNQVNKDQYGNTIVQQNPSNTMNAMGINNVQQQQLQQQQLQQQQQQLQQQQLQQQQLLQQQPQQPQQSQLYGAASGQTGTNPLLRNTNMVDNNAHLMTAGSAGSSGYQSSNAQVGYQPNANQLLNNKNVYNPATNTNNNQYGYNANSYPNSNTYSGQMAATNNNNAWANNQYSSNTGDAWMQNRDVNNNNNNAPNNPSSPYFYTNDSHHLMTSCFILLCSFLTISFFRM